MQVIAISGGKGGVGKTTISVNLSMMLAKMGKKVMLFDADLGLANIDVLLGIKPKLTINDVLNGKASLNEVCVTGPSGIKIIPGASGVQGLADLDTMKSIELIKSFSTMAEDIDYMLVDVAAGISKQVIQFTHASQNILLVVCNDPSSMIDSYAVTKILYQMHNRNNFGVIINKVKTMKEGYDVFLRFQETVSKFLNANIEYVGYVPSDDYINMAAREHSPVVSKYPFSPASIAFNELAKGVSIWSSQNNHMGGIQFFFEKMINHNQNIAKGEMCEA